MCQPRVLGPDPVLTGIGIADFPWRAKEKPFLPPNEPVLVIPEFLGKWIHVGGKKKNTAEQGEAHVAKRKKTLV